MGDWLPLIARPVDVARLPRTWSTRVDGETGRVLVTGRVGTGYADIIASVVWVEFAHDPDGTDIRKEFAALLAATLTRLTTGEAADSEAPKPESSKGQQS